MTSFGFPQRPATHRTGRSGEVYFEDFVTRQLGWVFRPVHRESDYGIDGYIDITRDGTITGKGLAVQIKTGDEYVARRKDGSIRYRGENRHLNYFLNHPLPVILVVLDAACTTGYWVEFDVAKTTGNARRWWIEIPARNTLRPSVAGQWTALAGDAEDFSADVSMMWAVDELMQKTAYNAFVVSHDDVLAGDISYLTALAARLSKTRTMTLESRGKLSLSFRGYDDDARELPEIPEVRRWFALAEQAQIPWFYFLETDPGHTLALTLFCTVPVEIKRSDGRLQMQVAPQDRSAWLERNFVSLNSFAEQNGIDERIVEERSKAVLESIVRRFL